MADKAKQHPQPLVALLLLSLVLVGCRSGGPTANGSSQAAAQADRQPQLEAVRLPAPADDDQRTYLGLPAMAPFALAEIQTRVLIIEFYSMYCPHCQREAPRVNRLYEQIMADARIRSQIKLIGVAVGNTSYEIDIFRQTYDVRFPLFADRTRTVTKSLGINRTPTFVGILYPPQGQLNQFLFETGGLEDTDEFLANVIRRAGIKLDGSAQGAGQP